MKYIAQYGSFVITMTVKTFFIEWDDTDLFSMAEVLMFGVPNLKDQVERQMKKYLDEYGD